MIPQYEQKHKCPKCGKTILSNGVGQHIKACQGKSILTLYPVKMKRTDYLTFKEKCRKFGQTLAERIRQLIRIDNRSSK